MVLFKLVLVVLGLLFVNDVLVVEGFFDLSRYKLIDPPPKLASEYNRIRTDQYIEQKIDNFNPTDTRTYLQVRSSFSLDNSATHVNILTEISH